MYECILTLTILPRILSLATEMTDYCCEE